LGSGGTVYLCRHVWTWDHRLDRPPKYPSRNLHAPRKPRQRTAAEISSASTSPTGWSCPRSLPTTSKQSVQGGTKWMHSYAATSMRIFATDSSRSQMEAPRTQSSRRSRMASGSMAVLFSTPESEGPAKAPQLERSSTGESTFSWKPRAPVCAARRSMASIGRCANSLRPCQFQRANETVGLAGSAGCGRQDGRM
jgi:hypothetical protein